MPDKYLNNTVCGTGLPGHDVSFYKEEFQNPFKVQVGGDHYKNFPIQPGEFINKNKLTWYEGNAVKYITRARYKGKFLEDMEKARHYLELAIAEWKEQNDNAN